MADDPHAAGLQRGARLPGRQQVLDDREQLLLRRVPRLEQVVVERDLVDRGDRRLGVGVGGQQHALGVRDDLARLDEVLGARHARHPLVGDQQRDLVAARRTSAQQLERLGARGRAQDPVALAEAAPQVARDRGQHRRLVVDGDDRGAPLALRGVSRPSSAARARDRRSCGSRLPPRSPAPPRRRAAARAPTSRSSRSTGAGRAAGPGRRARAPAARRRSRRRPRPCRPSGPRAAGSSCSRRRRTTVT